MIFKLELGFLESNITFSGFKSLKIFFLLNITYEQYFFNDNN